MTAIQSVNSATLERRLAFPQSSHLVWGPWARLGTTRSFQYLLQCKNVRFKDEDTVFPGMFRGSLVLAVSPVLLNWHALNLELESETSLSFIGPTPQGCFTDATDNLRRLMNVQVSAGFIDVRFELCHPDTQRHSVPQFKDDDWGPDRGFQVHPCDQADGFYQ